jgi:hypothetical protein
MSYIEFTLKRALPTQYEICLQERLMYTFSAFTELDAMEIAQTWLSSFNGTVSVSWDVQPEYTHHE